MISSDESALLDKADESQRAARVLASGGFYSFAGARAYYSMLYAAEAMLSTKSLAFSSHSAVISAFGLHFAKTRLVSPDLHRHLMLAFSLRQGGDYGTEATPAEAAEQAILWADEFIATAKSYLATIDSNLQGDHLPT